MAKPRITGRATVRDASANYSDFPVGLSHFNGDLVFDRSRLLFENVTADSGGGQLTLNGSVTYGEEARCATRSPPEPRKCASAIPRA